MYLIFKSYTNLFLIFFVSIILSKSLASAENDPVKETVMLDVDIFRTKVIAVTKVLWTKLKIDENDGYSTNNLHAVFHRTVANFHKLIFRENSYLLSNWSTIDGRIKFHQQWQDLNLYAISVSDKFHTLRSILSQITDLDDISANKLEELKNYANLLRRSAYDLKTFFTAGKDDNHTFQIFKDVR